MPEGKGDHPMDGAVPVKRRFFSTAVFCMLLLWGAVSEAAAARKPSTGDVFRPLKMRLVREGLDPGRVSSAFTPSPTPMFGTVSKTLRMRESQLDYDQFLVPANMEKARAFLRAHERPLKGAEARLGVEPQVIVAILLVETRFGGYTGQVPTFAVLCTFALMDQKELRDRIWALLPPKDRARWERSAFDEKLLKRSRWAYEEVRALLEISGKDGRRPDWYKGSVMGAIGWPQFLPSSILRFAVDGDGDGRINLYAPEDTIFSVANYLREHGWNQARTELQREEVIYTYNRSRPYVRTILEIASRLKAAA